MREEITLNDGRLITLPPGWKATPYVPSPVSSIRRVLSLLPAELMPTCSEGYGVAADWLEEKGFPESARLLRLEVEIRKLEQI